MAGRAMKPARGAGKAGISQTSSTARSMPGLVRAMTLLTGLHFHDVGFHLGEEGVIQSQGKGGEGRIDEAMGPCFISPAAYASACR